MKKLFIFALIALVLGAYFMVSSVGSATVGPKRIVVTKGDTPNVLHEKLSIPVASWRFRLYMRFYQANFKLQTGTYEIPEAMAFRDALRDRLAKPTTTDITITILPGWNMADIDGYLAKVGISKPGDLLQLDAKTIKDLKAKYAFLNGLDTLEGTLYPDTYRIRPDGNIKDVLTTLLNTFQSRIYDKMPASRKKDFESTLILASILEKEERDPDNKAMVAGILSKRLKQRIALGADATLCYVEIIPTSECTPRYIVGQLDSESPYNTRKHLGLPPTPIANPSRDTWLAALNPEDSEYLYYLHDDRGSIHYARTNEEHNQNRVRYLGK
jgi:UPF0755 protein